MLVHQHIYADFLNVAQNVDSGVFHINWTPLWRSDLVPYGEVKGSGIGKEGIRYAVQEMSESKTIVFHECI